MDFTFVLQVIRDAIDVFQKKNETFKLASKELNVEEPVSGETTCNTAGRHPG